MKNHAASSQIFLSQTYSASQVNAAVNQACNYYENGQQVGSNDYPHKYNNYEGFDFQASGPWQEFPILKSGVYTGGKFDRLYGMFVKSGSSLLEQLKALLALTALSSTTTATTLVPSRTLALLATTSLAALTPTRVF